MDKTGKSETLGNDGGFGKPKMPQLKSFRFKSLNIVSDNENLQMSFSTQISVCHFHYLPDLQTPRFLILFPVLIVKEHQTELLEKAQQNIYVSVRLPIYSNWES